MVIKNSTKFISSALLCGVPFFYNFPVYAGKGKTRKNTSSISENKVNGHEKRILNEFYSHAVMPLRDSVDMNLRQLRRARLARCSQLSDEILLFISGVRSSLCLFRNHPLFNSVVSGPEILKKINKILIDLEKNIDTVSLNHSMGKLNLENYEIGDLERSPDDFGTNDSDWFAGLRRQLDDVFNL